MREVCAEIQFQGQPVPYLPFLEKNVVFLKAHMFVLHCNSVVLILAHFMPQLVIRELLQVGRSVGQAGPGRLAEGHQWTEHTCHLSLRRFLAGRVHWLVWELQGQNCCHFATLGQILRISSQHFCSVPVPTALVTAPPRMVRGLRGARLVPPECLLPRPATPADVTLARF